MLVNLCQKWESVPSIVVSREQGFLIVSRVCNPLAFKKKEKEKKNKEKKEEGEKKKKKKILLFSFDKGFAKPCVAWTGAGPGIDYCLWGGVPKVLRLPLLIIRSCTSISSWKKRVRGLYGTGTALAEPPGPLNGCRTGGGRGGDIDTDHRAEAGTGRG